METKRGKYVYLNSKTHKQEYHENIIYKPHLMLVAVVEPAEKYAYLQNKLPMKIKA